jgi:hypothetical protein
MHFSPRCVITASYATVLDFHERGGVRARLDMQLVE